MLEKNIEILKNYYKENNYKINGMKLKKWLDSNKDILNEINEELNKHQNLKTKNNIIYCIVHDIDLNSFKCKTCGKELTVTHITQIPKFCSTKCAASNTELQQAKKVTISKVIEYYHKRFEKAKKTNLEKYGTKTPAESEIVKKHMKETFSKDPDIWKKRQEKSNETCLKRYGVKYASASKEVRQKIINSYLEKYGVDNPNKLNETLEKIKQTCLKKYGVDCQFKRQEIIQLSIKKSWNNILMWKDYVTPLFSFDDYSGYNKKQVYKWKCSKCGKEFEQHLYHTKISSLSMFIPRCPFCFPIKSNSYKEIELFNFIKEYFPNAEHNNRQLIKPQELDIVIPEKHIAFEFNGVYWHSDKKINDFNYHLNKTIEAEKQGYKLIHIWEFDWVNKQDIVKEKIKAILGIEQTNIYARKCLCKIITAKQKNEFLNKYHIQGEDKSSIKLGLFYENELVAVMTFGKPRFNKKYEWELIRYATSKHIIGGCSKLLKYFERNYNPKSLITYADRCYSQGNMYRKIGFTEINPSKPNYFWVKENIYLSRYQCQKHKLKNILGNNFNENLSEDENMKLNGFLKIFDCGNLVFEKNYNL